MCRKEEVAQQIQVAGEEVPNIIRSIAFSPDGKYFAAGGDDKEVYIYDVETWKLLGTFKSQKKLSCVLFTPDSSHVLAANKYGDILVAPVPTGDVPLHGSMDIIMGHFCSIIMSMSISKVGSYMLATTDRDGKVRITALPENIAEGAHNIVSFCLGHEKFVSSCSFLIDGKSKSEYIVTGGGDGLVKLWNPQTGEELDSVNVTLPVLDMVTRTEEDVVFLVLDGSAKIVTISVNERKLQILMHETDIPLITGVDVSDDALVWMVGGPIGKPTGMRIACMRWSVDSMESIEFGGKLREMQQCSEDDSPLNQSHLPEYMEKKGRIFT